MVGIISKIYHINNKKNCVSVSCFLSWTTLKSVAGIREELIEGQKTYYFTKSPSECNSGGTPKRNWGLDVDIRA